MNIFNDTMPVMSQKGLIITTTQEQEFIEDFLSDKISSVGAVSFHPLQKQISIESLQEGDDFDCKTYVINEPSGQLIKFMFASGNNTLKKYVYHYTIQQEERIC